MNAPTAELLLRVWEEQQGAHPIRRALALLDAAWPEVGAEAWARATIGERDACLLWLHEGLFGPQLQTVTRCPRCGERLESALTTTQLRVQAPALPAPQAPLQLQEDDYAIAYRLPSSEDLLALAGQPCAAPAQALLGRCVCEARHRDRPIELQELPAAVVDRLGAAMAERDPGAELRIALDCPGCRHAWTIAFDIVSYLWGELEDWAQRLLAEVHLLASHYGWSERDILALGPVRRRIYLDMVRA